MSSSKMTTAEAEVELQIDMAADPSLADLKVAYRRLALEWVLPRHLCVAAPPHLLFAAN